MQQKQSDCAQSTNERKEIGTLMENQETKKGNEKLCSPFNQSSCNCKLLKKFAFYYPQYIVTTHLRTYIHTYTYKYLTVGQQK